MLMTLAEVKNIELSIYEELSSLFDNKNSNFPCAFAKSSFNLDCMNIGIYDFFLNHSVIKEVSNDLRHISTKLKLKNRTEYKERFETFVTIYKRSDIQSTVDFQNVFFTFLQDLHEIDLLDWPQDFTKDPEDSTFSFCFNGDIWFPVSLSPFHKYSIRNSRYIIIAFQPGLTFDLNKTKYQQKFSTMRLSIHKKIDSLYKGKLPLYLTPESEGKNYVQYIGDDPKLTDSTYKCPLKII